MKVFFLGHLNAKQQMAPVKRSICLAKGMTAAGLDVEIDVMHQVFSINDVDDLESKGYYDGIKYVFINGHQLIESSILRFFRFRILNKWGAFFYYLKHLNKGDIVYAYSMLCSEILLLKLAVVIRRAKLVLEIVEIPFYHDKLISRIRRFFTEHFAFALLDGATCISEALEDYVKEHSSKRTKITQVPILVSDIVNIQTDSEYRVPYIIHTGSMLERKDGISYILKAFAEFKKTDNSACRLVFAGPDSNEKCSYNSMIRDLGIKDYVDLLGMITDSVRLASLQKNAALSIVYRFDNTQTRHGFSTKMGEILIAGTPLITTPVGGHTAYLSDGVNVKYVEPGNVGQLTEAITLLIHNKEIAAKIGQNGRKLAQQVFNPYYQGQRIKTFFNSIQN